MTLQWEPATITPAPLTDGFRIQADRLDENDNGIFFTLETTESGTNGSETNADMLAVIVALRATLLAEGFDVRVYTHPRSQAELLDL